MTISKADEEVGRLLESGRYRLDACIGVGGMGSVYQALDTRLGVERAIKLIHVGARDPNRDSRGVKAEIDGLHGRLITEALAAQELGALTRHVVRVFDVGRCEERDEPFLVMELLDGETLEARLEYSGPMPVGEALAVGRVLAETVGHAHQVDIVHRDLKPANVMFVQRGGRDDFPVILDFGLARLEWPGRPRTRSGDILGTIPYMAPELLMGQGASPQSDVFALGAVLYEMLAGVRAVPGASDSAVFETLLKTGVTPIGEVVAGLPEAVCKVVDRCLRRRPHQRPSTAMALASALDGVLRRLGPDEAAFIAPVSSPVETTSGEAPDAAGRLVDPLGSFMDAAPEVSAVDVPETPPSEASIEVVRSVEVEPVEPAAMRPPSLVAPSPAMPAPLDISPPSGEIGLTDPLPIEPTAPQPAAEALVFDYPPERRPKVVVGAAIVVAGLAAALGLFALQGSTPATASPPMTERPTFPLEGIGKPREEAVTEAEVAAVLRKPPAAPQPAATAPPTTEAAAKPKPARSKPREASSKKKRGGVIAHYASTREAKPPSGERRFFAPGGTIPLPEQKKAGASAIPAGTQVEAELVVGVSSGRHMPVVARTTEAIVVGGQTIAPAGTQLRGRSTDDGDRVYLDFTHIGDHGLRAHAVTAGRPGLAARKRGAPSDERGGKALARGALDTASVIGAGLGAGVAGDLARNVGREAVGEARREATPDRRTVLKVAPGARFTVVVTGGAR